jgi:uncharacterized membrane protein YfcA
MSPVPGRPRWGAGALAAITVGTGALAGLTAGLFGVGGGIVIVPPLVAFAALSQHQAHATSLAAIVPIAAVAGTRFAIEGSVDWSAAALLSAGTLLGAPIGAWLLARSSAGALNLAFGAFMLIVAARLLLG